MRLRSFLGGSRPASNTLIYWGMFAAVLVGICCNHPREVEVSANAAPAASTTGATITASPNPIPADANKFGKTVISWDTGDNSLGEVYVSTNGEAEKRFTGALAKGSQEATWIGKGEYVFRLYAGKDHKTVLATVTVTRNKP